MKLLAKCFRLFVVLVILTGVIYPLLVTGIAELIFPAQAEGSLVTINGKIVGSSLLAQKTQSPKYFWPRPSAGDYATVASGVSNLGPTSGALQKAISDNSTTLRQSLKLAPNVSLPDDLITTSGSGLDPHISPASAQLQMDRVAAARGFTVEQKTKLAQLVKQFSEGPQWGFLGQPRVNVLLLNRAVDQL